MNVYALDTNIVSYYLREDNTIVSKFNEILQNGDKIAIPPFVYYEVKRGLETVNAVKKLTVFETICSIAISNVIKKDTLDIAVKIYTDLCKKGKIVGDSDLFIAACCIQNDYILVTNNVKHFENIAGLTIENWV
jgi:tRNA(fMet)-specific endonuclease VapC